jgi:hypothetical protein
MNRTAKMTIMLLAIFAIGMAMAAMASQPVAANKFSDKGYTWEIETGEWINMKRMAEAEYDNAVNQGRAMCRGFSNSHNVTVTKDGAKYDLIAFAVKNDNSMRCEVRGLSSGYLTDYKHV